MKIEIEYYKNQGEFINKAEIGNKYFLFVPENENINIEKLNGSGIEVCGAIFPDIIYQNSSYKDGLLAYKIDSNSQLHFIKDKRNYEFKKEEFKDKKSVITIVEGFKEDNDDFLYSLFENLDINTNIIGGAAGLLKNENNKKIFFDNYGQYDDCAIIIAINKNINISAKHGWEHLVGPFVITSSEGQVVKSIDYKPALEVYKEVVEKNCNEKLTGENFFDLTKNYPVGVVKYFGESLVRDVIGFDGNNLILANSVDENTMINVLKGNKSNLIDAAREAAVESKCESKSCILTFNCISRKQYLDNDFEKELDAIYSQEDNCCLVGVITLGEIANSGNRNVYFLNKTCVVGSLCY